MRKKMKKKMAEERIGGGDDDPVVVVVVACSCLGDFPLRDIRNERNGKPGFTWKYYFKLFFLY